MPFLAVVALAWGSGQVQFTAPKRSIQPNVTFVFVGPCLALGLRAISDVQFVAYKPALLMALVFGVPLTLLVYWYAPDLRRRPLMTLVALPFAFGYGYGLFTQINCMLDGAKPTVYVSRIVTKHISHGSRGSTYYYLGVQAWGPFDSKQQIRVSKQKYYAYFEGDKISLSLKPGTLGAPWFYVASKPSNEHSSNPALLSYTNAPTFSSTNRNASSP